MAAGEFYIKTSSTNLFYRNNSNDEVTIIGVTSPGTTSVISTVPTPAGAGHLVLGYFGNNVGLTDPCGMAFYTGSAWRYVLLSFTKSGSAKPTGEIRMTSGGQVDIYWDGAWRVVPAIL